MNSLWKRNAKMTFSHLELRFQREFRVLTQLSLKYQYVSPEKLQTQNRSRGARSITSCRNLRVPVFYDVYSVSGPLCTQKSPFSWNPL